MTQWLRQSTAGTVHLGPFVDATDGATAETGLTISQADIRLSKAGADFAQIAGTANAPHDENGYYFVGVGTADTDTLGRLKIGVAEGGALSVWETYMVVPGNVFDSLFGSDRLQVDAVELSGDSGAADNAEAFFDGTGYAGTNNVIPTVTALTGHTAQTGDSFARIGAAGVSLSDLGGMSTGMKTEVESEANDALVALNLDHLMKTVTAGADMTSEVPDNTVLSRMMANGDTSAFVPSTDGLQLIRDKLTDIETDTAEIGTAGAGLTDLGGMSSGMKTEIESEANDALVATNLDHLMKQATGSADMTSEVPDNTVLSRMMANGDTSAFVPSTDGLQPIRDRGDAAWDTADVSALATSANQTTILARLGSWTGTGINTVLGAFKAILSKVASMPSDMGGTGDPAADSLEAIRDQGDSAWVTAPNDPTVAAIADGVHDEIVEGSTTMRQMLRGFAAMLLSEASGGDSSTLVWRDIGDTKNRVTFTVDADGNRTGVTLDLT